MPNKNILFHGQTTESHETIFPTCQYFASSNITVKSMTMFVHLIIGQIQFQFSLSLSNRET